MKDLKGVRRYSINVRQEGEALTHGGSVWRLGPSSSWKWNRRREKKVRKGVKKCQWKTGLQVSGRAVMYMICC